MIQTIQHLLSEGKLSEAIMQATAWAKGNADSGTYNAVILLSQRHATNEKAHLMNQIHLADYSMERNRISMALLATVHGATAKTADVPLVKRLNWVGIGGFLIGLIALIANIGTIKDAFFKKEEPKTVVQPVAPPKAEEKPTTVAPNDGVTLSHPVIKPKSAPSSSSGKNNTHINVQGNGKVGTVITGDSNKIDLHQNF